MAEEDCPFLCHSEEKERPRDPAAKRILKGTSYRGGTK